MTRFLLSTLMLALATAPALAAAPGPEDSLLSERSGPLTGSIEISNERQRPIQVFIDGKLATEVAARATEIIPDVPNGVRVVAYGNRGDRFQVDKVEVRIDRRSALRVAPLKGIAVIHNETRDTMRVKFGDDDLGIVMPGKDLSTDPMREGTYTVSYLPRDSREGPARNEKVEIVAGETAHVTLRAFYAELVVRNPFPFEVSLFLDGRRVGRIDPRDELTLDHLSPARVAASLRRDQKLMAETRLELEAGRTERWQPEVARYGDLEVRNPGRFPVRIRIGAMSDFSLRPGEARFFSNLESGPTMIEVEAHDGRIIKHQVDIRADERARFEVPTRDR